MIAPICKAMLPYLAKTAAFDKGWLALFEVFGGFCSEGVVDKLQLFALFARLSSIHIAQSIAILR